MKCDAMHIYQFVGFGDGDNEAEIVATSNAIRSKYMDDKRHPELKNLDIIHVNRLASGPDTKARNPIKSQEGIDFSAVRNGVYLMCHGGPTISKPPGSYLADMVFDDLIATGANVTKINIASCQSAGSSFKAGDIDKSPLAQFCKRLLERARHAASIAQKTPGKDGRPVVLPPGLMVCAYIPKVTTFDASIAPFSGMNDAQREKKLDAGLRAAIDPPRVRTAIMKDGGFKETHPIGVAEARKQACAIINDIVKADGVKKANTKHEALAIVRRFDNSAQQPAAAAAQSSAAAPSAASASAPAPPQENHAGNLAAIEQLTANNAKVMTQLALGLKDDASKEYWLAMENYIRTKVVMRLAANGLGFEQTSLAQYTDNAELKTSLAIIEQGYEKKKAILNIRLDP